MLLLKFFVFPVLTIRIYIVKTKLLCQLSCESHLLLSHLQHLHRFIRFKQSIQACTQAHHFDKNQASASLA